MHEFCYENVKDPRYFSDNRVPAHSDHRYYASVADMEQKEESFKESLNGLWKLRGMDVPQYANVQYSGKAMRKSNREKFQLHSILQPAM